MKGLLSFLLEKSHGNHPICCLEKWTKNKLYEYVSLVYCVQVQTTNQKKYSRIFRSMKIRHDNIPLGWNRLIWDMCLEIIRMPQFDETKKCLICVTYISRVCGLEIKIISNQRFWYDEYFPIVEKAHYASKKTCMYCGKSGAKKCDSKRKMGRNPRILCRECAINTYHHEAIWVFFEELGRSNVMDFLIQHKEFSDCLWNSLTRGKAADSMGNISSSIS